MPILPVCVLTILAALWLYGHHIAKRRFAFLKSNLPDIYQSAIAVPPQENGTAPIIALCIDLMRKKHSSVSFDALTADEQRMALHAHAIEAVPVWMSRYAALGLSSPNRALITQLRQVHSSRPDKKPIRYYGEVKRQQQLRSASES